MMGELKILELRDKAKKTLGDKFSIKEFHNAVLATGTVPLDLLEHQVDAYLRTASVVASLPKGESVVPVYHEPHHRMVFAAGTTKILDGQVPPGDTSWFHTHAEPILYLTLSTSQQRIQVLGQEWSGGGGRGAAPAPGRGNGPPSGAPAAPASGPAVRVTSTTSYFDQPVTHRITNVGDRLFRFIVVTNASAGDETDTVPGASFPGKPELTNRWFRAYRVTLAPGQATEPHRHPTEAVIVQTSDGRALAPGPMTFELGEQGRWAWFDAGKVHEIRNVGNVPFEFVEVEVRHPSAQ
jgi:quercetin dioxygenase-like cupin family protein